MTWNDAPEIVRYALGFIFFQLFVMSLQIYGLQKRMKKLDGK